MRSNSIKKIIASAITLSILLTVSNFIGQSSKTVQARDEIIIESNLSGKLTILPNVYNYDGDEVVAIAIPEGLKVKDVEIIDSNLDLYENLDEEIINNHIIISGLASGTNYEKLYLKLEGFDNNDYFYSVDPFVFTSNQPQNNTNSSNTNITNPYEKENRKKVIKLYLTNLYKNVFNRTIDTQGAEYWSEKLVTDSIRLRDFFKNLLTENEFMQIAPTTEDKIKKLYLGVFQRNPDQSGFMYWVNRYKQELTAGNNETGALIKIIDSMTSSGEFRGVLGKLRLNF